MKIVLVPGAAGFFGYHLCEKWLNESYFVIGIDNFTTGQKINITGLQIAYKNQFYFIEADISKPWTQFENKISALIKDQLLYVFHFASVACPH